MRWTTPNFLRSTLDGLLGSTSNELNRSSVRLEAIRHAMLDSLAEHAVGRSPLSIERRIVFAQDLQTLWYLRGDILSLISQYQGEAIARRVMEPITAMFEGYLPSGLFSRPIPQAH